jgi:hypothetical protein
MEEQFRQDPSAKVEDCQHQRRKKQEAENVINMELILKRKG